MCEIDTPNRSRSTIETGSPAAGSGFSKVIVLQYKNKGSGEARAFRINKERVVIGSVVSADVKLTGSGVSPIHAVLEAGPDGVTTVYDLASETGVFVNGAKVVTAPVRAGDRLTIGSLELEFSLSDPESVRSKLVIESPLKESAIREAEGRKLYLNPDEDLSPLLLESDRHIEEIFDYRPAQKRALEVIMAWHGTVLNVEHFVARPSVVLGVSRTADFGIPPLLSAARHVLATRAGEGSYTLNLDPKMEGVLQQKGRLSRLGQGGELGGSIPLGNDDFAKVSVGEIDFYLSYTAAPPRLKRSGIFERDPFFFKVLAMSMICTALFIGTLMNARVDKTLEAEQIPERIATILYQPEKYLPKPVPTIDKAPAVKTETTPPPKVEVKKPEPKPTQTIKVEVKPQNKPAEKKPLPKEMNVKPVETKSAKTPTPNATQNQAKKSQGQRGSKEGEGARAKGPEGTRGQKNAPQDVVHQNRATRPSPQGGRGGGATGSSQVPGIGNVDLLSSATAKISNILGNSSEKLGKGGSKFSGFGGFTTQGGGGLALSGTGQGGGGTSDLSQGLGDKGLGGGKVGTGLGAMGNGSGIIGGQARVAIRTGGQEEAVVMGSIDADAIEAAMRAHADEFRLCYEKEVNAENNKLAGRVSTTFVIGSSGRVTSAGIVSSSLGNANTERCILNVIRRIDFPIPRGAGVVQVKYPFKFSPTGGRS